MLYHQTKKIMRGFAGIVAVLVILIIGGGFFLGENDFIGRGTFALQRKLRSVAYALDYQLQKSQSLGAAIVYAVQGNTQNESAIDDAADASLVPVLLYHGVVSKADRFSITEDTLKEQLFALKRAGYQTIGLEELHRFIARGVPVPERSFVLTFDDGRRDSYRNTDALLGALGFKAVMFVASDPSIARSDGRYRYYINERDVQAMAASGRWEIGSHAIQDTGGRIVIAADGEEGNFLSNRRWLTEAHRLETETQYTTRIRQEMEESQQALERSIGAPVIAFSYPFGDYGQQTENHPNANRTIDTLVRQSYRLAFQQVWPGDTSFTFNSSIDDPIHLRRIEVPTHWSGDDLITFLNQVREKPINYRDELATNNGWKSAWGAVAIHDGFLQLAATESTTGALTFLDGTQHWQDYFFSVRGQWPERGYVSLIARYQDGDNYRSCTFGAEDVFIDDRVGGVLHRLKAVEHSVVVPGKNASFGILVNKNKVTCYIGSRAVAIVYNTSQELSYGGIAVKVWDETPGTSSLMLDSLVTGAPQATQVLLQALPRYVTR